MAIYKRITKSMVFLFKCLDNQMYDAGRYGLWTYG